ncbi:MAG: hypothetical protein ABFS56_21770 [Pseudomonadota bacterium]
MAFFPELRHKAIRVIQYANSSRTETLREWEEKRGYAISFFHAVDILLPTREIITPKGLCSDMPMYPPTAIRELVANMKLNEIFNICLIGHSYSGLPRKQPKRDGIDLKPCLLICKIGSEKTYPCLYLIPVVVGGFFGTVWHALLRLQSAAERGP